MKSNKNNVNKVIIIGNLGQDPELRQTPSGYTFTKLSLATNYSKKKADGQFEDLTEWHKAVVWGKRAESCVQYLKKGNRVYIEGELHTQSWKDKEGNKHKTTEIFVDEIKFLGGRREEAAVAIADQVQ